MNVECIILAAGLSSRMGINKMLLEIDGKTVIERCIGSFYESCSKIIVVTGRYHEDIKQCISSYSKVHIVYNSDYRQGMFSSVKTGVRRIGSQRFFLTPGDYPYLEADTIHHMIKTTGCLVAPVYKGEQGHPVLLDKLFIPVILNSTSISLRDCLSEFRFNKLCVNDEGIIKDIDTWKDFGVITKQVR